MYQWRVVFTVGLFFADYAVRFNQHGGLQESAAHVALVAAGFFAAAVGAFAFHESVRQKALVMLAVEHLGILLEDVAVLLDFKQGFLDKLLCALGSLCWCNYQMKHPICGRVRLLGRGFGRLTL